MSPDRYITYYEVQESQESYPTFADVLFLNSPVGFCIITRLPHRIIRLQVLDSVPLPPPFRREYQIQICDLGRHVLRLRLHFL